MSSRETTPHILAGALAAFVFAFLPARAFAALPADGSDVPVVRGEAPARSCYLRAEELWNRTMAQSPRDHRQLDTSYRTFATCAKVAIDTGRVLRNGQRLPWLPEYFANTVGATYAQLQLATITYNSEHCTHLTQARDLAQQALETEGEMDTPGDATFEQTWDSLRKNLKSQTATCGKSAFHMRGSAGARAYFRESSSNGKATLQ
ncbi:MAG TPA: hypothetical protein VJP85_12485 [Candidatus Baltobacteraceae bacterium]|nr:hypothetical protein [Candidatus Baltobacteraceae bacterium]